MKTITKHLMPRYMWFMLWFKAWFKNTEGIKGFATQVLNWLMQRTMNLAKRLKNQNKKMAEAIKTRKAQLLKWYEHPTVDADEWDSIKGTVRKLWFWIFVGMVAETACNYFAIESVMEAKGLGWTLLRCFVALAATGVSFYFFEQWFAMAINKPAYKQVEVKKRNWAEFGLVTLVCVAFEVFFYWLCLKRSNVLEGASGDDATKYVVMILGMLLPIAVGYYAYKRSRYLNAYKNTLRIAGAEKEIAKKESTIATNNQQMEDHFKCELHDTWTVLDEFRVYKENYNEKHNIKKENLAGHFCETYNIFEKEAMERYKKEVLHITPVQPTLIFTKEQMNGRTKELPQTIINH